MGIKKPDIVTADVSPIHNQSTSGGCSTCARICEEAKAKVKSLEKKVYIMTIVCTSAITLLGEKGIQSLITALNGVNSAMSAAAETGSGEPGQKDGNKNSSDSKQSNNNFLNPRYQRPWQPPVKLENKEQTRGYRPTDELARFSKENKIGGDKPVEEPISVIVDQQKTTQEIIKAAMSNDTSLIAGLANQSPVAFADPYAVFFTPSLLPFDVYSTTLALGNNYGFGEYYGIDTGSSYVAPSVPSPGTVTLLFFSQFTNTRKRS
jgi:hypothetical protein